MVRDATVRIDNYTAKKVGSGVLVSAEGDILTIAAIVQNAVEVELLLPDGTEGHARVVARDEDGGLALLKCDGASARAFVKIGDATACKRGMDVWVAGFAGVLESERAAVTHGSVTAVPAYGMTPRRALLEVDASMNFGFGGSPVVDGRGALLGLMAGFATDAERRNFAVPVNAAAALPLPVLATLKTPAFDAWVAQAKEPAPPKSRSAEGIEGAIVRLDNFDRKARGTGFVVSADGHILSSTDLVGNASAIDVRFADGSVESAYVVASDARSHLALLKVDGRNDRSFLKLADATTLVPARPVAAWSYPETSDTVVTRKGVISAVPVRSGGRPYIQYDAAAAIGDSGGPLVTESGEVAGVLLATVAGAEGIHLAVPINAASALPLDAAASLATPAYQKWIDLAQRKYRDPGEPLGATSDVAKSVVRLATPAGAGSGFFVSSDGDVLTALHVVDGAGAVDVTLWDGSLGTASVTASDRDADLALLRVSGVTVPPALPLGDATAIEVGSTTTALGHALGTSHVSVTGGVISAVPILLEGSRCALIQFDAAVNPGNSGGPIVDGAGRAIGIVDAKILGGERMSYAVPINYASLLPLPAAKALASPAFTAWKENAAARSSETRKVTHYDTPPPPAGPDAIEIHELVRIESSAYAVVSVLDRDGKEMMGEGHVSADAEWNEMDNLGRPGTHFYSCHSLMKYGPKSFKDRNGSPVLLVLLDCPELHLERVATIKVHAEVLGGRKSDDYRAPRD
ncbi:MAG: trypsin-like peptidase domain-containing protein [Acidobacteriota bacterium]